MIWQSISLMTAVDILILAVVGYAAAEFLRDRRRPGRSSEVGFVAILGGLSLVALFYLADLLVMHAFPRFMSSAEAMSIMRDLHLNGSWLVALFGIGTICLGFASVNRATAALLDGLMARERDLGRELAQRKAAEVALQESEEWLQLITDTVPVGISYFDKEQRFRFANQQYESMLGLKPSEIIGKTLEQVIGKEPYQIVRKYAQRALSGQTVSFENTLPAKNGGQISIAVSYAPDIGADETVKGFFALVQDITASKQAEKALQESEGRFRDIAKASGDWFWETDADHRFTWISDRVEDVAGVPVEFHIGKSRLELAADQVEQEKWRTHLETLETRRPFRDFRYLRRGHDGRLHHMSSSGVPVFDAEGNFKGYRGAGTDISAEVKAEQRAASAQERFMAAIESVADGFALFDADDRMVFCNSRFKEQNPDLAPKIVPGITFEEMLRDNIADKRILDALGNEESFIRKRMKQHRTPRGPLVQQRRDGRWLELREERTPEGSTFLINTDITERKRAEEALRGSEAQFHHAEKIAHLCHWISDNSFANWTYASPNTEALFGVPRDELLGSHSKFIAFLHPNDRDSVLHAYSRLVVKPKRYELNYRIVRNDGEIRHFREVGEAETNDAGQVAQFRGTTQDVTELKRVEEEIRKLNVELEQRVEARTAELHAAQAGLLRQERLATLGQLTATVSHELRNPLGTIRASIFTLRKGIEKSKPVVQRSLERIERSILRCDQIVDELLDFTRISELEPVPTPVDAWLEETLNEQALPAEVTLRRDFGLGAMAVPLDKNRLRRAIINVFDNACQAMSGDATEDAATDGRVLTVRTRKRQDRVEVIFEDVGPGIPSDVYENIFEPLFSTKGFGVGLGLPVVKQIMEQHGGGIEIESQEGQGTRVCLWLPPGHAGH